MFGFNYQKPGKGVNKRDPNQPKISIFFELLGRKLFNLLKVNLWYLLTAIPTFLVAMVIAGIVTSPIIDSSMDGLKAALSLNGNHISEGEFLRNIFLVDMILRVFIALVFTVFIGHGPTTAGITYILRNYSREEHSWLFSDWWQHTKANAGQAILVWLIDVLVFLMVVVAVRFYVMSGGAMILLAGLLVVIYLIYLMMHFYIYQLMITFKNSLKNIFKNAFILTMEKSPRNLLMFFILFLVHILLPFMAVLNGWGMKFWLVFVLLEVLILVSVSLFMVNFFVYTQLERYIKEDSEENSL